MEHAWLVKDKEYAPGSVATELQKYEDASAAYKKRKTTKTQ